MLNKQSPTLRPTHHIKHLPFLQRIWPLQAGGLLQQRDLTLMAVLCCDTVPRLGADGGACHCETLQVA